MNEEFAREPEAPGAQRVPIWVLDTNVVLDWLIFSDPSVARIAHAIEAGHTHLVTRADCREELVRVLDYPRIPASVDERQRALASFDRFARLTVVAPSDLVLPLCRDTDDQKFLELARDSHATWLISKDKWVLRLAPRVRAMGLFEILRPDVANERLHDARAPL